MDARENLFRQLMEDHGGAVARIAGGFSRTAAEREDLVQDIWLAVWRALPAFRGDASLKTFVLRIAQNRAISSIAKRFDHAGLDAAAEVAGNDAPDIAASRDEDAERLRIAVRRLPLGLRQAVLLRLEGLSLAEIAAVLGISENNAAVRLNRSRERLRALLQVNA